MMGCKPRIAKDGRQRLMDRGYQRKTVRQKPISSICTGLISHRKWVFLSVFILHWFFSLFTLTCYFHLSFTGMNEWMENQKKKKKRKRKRMLRFFWGYLFPVIQKNTLQSKTERKYKMSAGFLLLMDTHAARELYVGHEVCFCTLNICLSLKMCISNC